MYRYRSTLQIGAGAVLTCNPVWGDDAAIEKVRSEGYAFFRSELAGDFVFLGDDARSIIDSDIEDEIVFILYWWNGASWVEQNKSVFTKADCDIHDNPGDVRAVPGFRTRDVYEKVLAGMNKEFDLIELAPAITEVLYTRQSLFQVYRQGSTILTSILAGSYFEETVVAESNSTTLASDYGFGLLGVYAVVIADPDVTLTPDVRGAYTRSQTSPTILKRVGDGAYEIALVFTGPDFQWLIRDGGGGTTRFEGAVNTAWSFPGLVLESVADASACRFKQEAWFCRLLTNALTLPDTTPTLPAPDPDLGGDLGQYSRVYPVWGGVSDDGQITWGDDDEITILGNADSGTVPTPWGLRPAAALYSIGEYYQQPETGAVPLERGLWVDCSWWFNFNAALTTLQTGTGEEIRLRNAYKLGDCIQAIISVLNPDLIHEVDIDDYSDLFYGATNPLRGNALTALITPKSNILNPDYSVPARKAKIRLSDLLGLCWSFYKAQWHLEDEFEYIRFRVEQAQYYENGGSYTVEVVGTDLTTAIEGKTARTWARDTNSYKYDKAKMPDRIEMEWMDTATKPFRGVPIAVRSRYADPGNIDQINLSPFSADIDYALLRAQDFSSDGFFFLEAELDGSDFRLPFVEIDVEGELFTVQNGYASIPWAQNQYHVKVMPAALVTINGVDVAADSVKRNRVQIIDSPVTDPEPDPMQLVTTAVGTGRLRSQVMNLESRTYKIEIEHDTL